MAVAYRAEAHNGGNTTSVNVTIPASVQTGDGMIALVVYSNANTPTYASGWTTVGTATSGSQSSTLLYRVAQAGDASSSTTWTMSATSRYAVAIVAYSGTHASTPVGAWTSGNTTNVAAITTPSDTTDNANSVEIQAVGERATTVGTWTPPGAIANERVDYQVTGGGGSISMAFGDTLTPLSSGASIGGDTWASSSSSTSFTMWTVELREGTSDVTATPSDTVTATDTVAVALSRAPSVQDTVAVTDSTTVTLAREPSVSDTVAVADSLTVGLARAPSVSDTATVTDSLTVTLARTVTISDTVPVTDSLTVTPSRVVAVSDTVSVTDTLTAETSGAEIASATDLVTVSDLVDIHLEIVISDDALVTDDLVPSVTAGGLVKVWDGIQWVSASVFVWQGSWTPADTKVWNNSWV